MTFSRDEEVLMMLYSPGTKSGLVKALRKMSADLDLDDPEDNQLYQLTVILRMPDWGIRPAGVVTEKTGDTRLL